MIIAMSVERLTVSLESELADAVRVAASAESLNVSAWMAQAAHRELASRGLREVVAEWEATHGSFTEKELAVARKKLRA
jgi:Mn-dependent DtxR family transcriptional regulator